MLRTFDEQQKSLITSLGSEQRHLKQRLLNLRTLAALIRNLPAHADIQALFDGLQSMDDNLRHIYTGMWYDSYADRPTITISATFAGVEIKAVSPALEMIEVWLNNLTEKPVGEWTTDDTERGRTFTIKSPFTEAVDLIFSVDLRVEDEDNSQPGQRPCYRVIEEASSSVVEYKKYRWVCK